MYKWKKEMSAVDIPWGGGKAKQRGQTLERHVFSAGSGDQLRSQLSEARPLRAGPAGWLAGQTGFSSFVGVVHRQEYDALQRALNGTRPDTDAAPEDKVRSLARSFRSRRVRGF